MGIDTSKLLADLAAPFGASEVDWRLGHTNKEKTSALALAYIDARAVADRLDAVCGPLWRCRYYELRNGARLPEREARDDGERKRPRASPSIIVCEIELKIGDEWIGRANGSGDSDHEPEKGAMSGAFKRAATMWGIGRYLYGFPSPWVDIVPQGRSFAIKNSEWPKLRKIAADALDAYLRDPAAFLAPRPPEPEPARPGFDAAQTPPPRPEPPRPPTPAAAPTNGAPRDALASVLATIAESYPPRLGLVVADARQRFQGNDLAQIDGAYVVRVRDLAGAAGAPAEIDALVAMLNATKPPRAAHGPISEALNAARRRVAQAAQGAAP